MNDIADRMGGLSDKKQRLMQLLAAKKKQTSSDTLAPRPADSGPLPLSHAQRGLWFLQRLAPESSFYHMPYAVHLAGALDVSALERAFNRLVERHEALCTSFPDVGGKPVQRIVPAQVIPVPLIDLQEHPVEEREATALRLAGEASLLPFDLTNGPMLRVSIYRLAPDEHLLMFSMHHIISDGWSIGVMMHELAMLYEAFRHGLPDPLPVPSIQYGDYALWHERRIADGALDDQLAYWRERLEGVQPVALATDFPRPAVQRFRGVTVPVEIPEALTAAVEGFARGRDATLFMTLLAAFKGLLFLHSGTRRLAVGTPVANREPKETESLIGFFANTLALATDCSGDPSFVELLERVRETTLGAFKHQDVPFEMLVEALEVERDPSRNPLFQVMFGLQAVSMREFGLPGLEAGSRSLDNDTTHFDMELHLWHRERHLGGYLSYNADLFERATIDRLIERLQALLEAVVADAERPLSTLGLAVGIDPAEASPGARIEQALLAQPAVEECVVLTREPVGERRGAEETVAYVVASRPLDLDALRRSLPTPPTALVPLSAIPRSEAGEVDEAALSALPVIDEALKSRWQRALQESDGVAQARVSLETPRNGRPWLHLADLLPADRSSLIVAPERETTSPSVEDDAVSRAEAPPAYRDGGPLGLPPEAPRTLGEALLKSAADHPERGLLLIQEGDDETFIAYPELLGAARAILAGLQERGLEPGDRVILQFSRLADHFSAFWACVLGGIVPVTVALAPSYRERGGVVNKLWNVWKLLHEPVLLSDEQLAPRLAGVPALFDEAAGEFRIWPVEGLRGDAEAARLFEADPEDLVFLQLTSGSTGVPKCVQETHRAIVHHVHGSQRFNGYGDEDVTLNWLPLDHVVPILTCHLKDTYLGLRQIQVATQVVLSEPLRWLDLIEAHRVTHSWAPNFGFKLINDRLARASHGKWDLSSMRLFMNAGEQVTRPVVDEFLRRLAPFGVGPDAMQPAFGMAEVSTCMTYQNGFDEETVVRRIAKTSLGGTLRPAEGDEASVTFVGLGPPMPGVEIRIADEANRVVAERVIGRLQIRGKVVMPGYLDNEEANREAFVGDGWFDSGDLGFMEGGRLALTGRAKETIIIRGANFYCYEVEEVVNGVEGVEPTFSAACAVEVAERGGEGLALFFVPRSGSTDIDPELIRRVRGEVSRQLGVAPDFIVPLERAAFPKTTSGKIQRMQLKRGLEAGEFDERIKAVDRAEKNANCLPDWFFRRAWQPRPLPAAVRSKPAGVTLVFADGAGLADRLAVGESVRVEPGEVFERGAADHYRIDPRRAEDYRALLTAVEERGRAVGCILHLWSYNDPSADDLDALEESQFRGNHSLLFLVQALAANPPANGAAGPRLQVVSSNLQALSDDHPVSWGHAPLLGLLRSVERELPWLACRHLDLPGDDPAADAQRLADELKAGGKETEVAWRDGRRWTPLLERVPFDGPRPLPLRRGGIYLLSGGLGGIGRALARYLVERWQARLVLVGRTPLTGAACLNFTDKDPAEQDARVEVLAELSTLGGEVLYAAADICDGGRMEEVMAAVSERWNTPLDGVFHLAGSFHTRALVEEAAESFAEGVRAKLSGSRVLHRLAPAGSLFVHVASVNGVFGGAMAGAYSAANSFVQAFTQYQRRSGLRAHCLSFSLWDEVGMSRGYALKEQSRAQGFLPIDAERGLHSLLVGLATDHPNLLIGLDGDRPNIRHHLKRESRPLQRLRAQLVAKPGRGAPMELPVLSDRFGTPSKVEVVLTDTLSSDADDDGRAAVGSHAPPTTEMQRTIAAIWCEVLGLSSVGVQQNFFELGGQSLALVQVHSRLQEALGREIPVVELLQYPTIGALAGALGEAPAKAAAFDDAVRRAQRQRAGRRQRGPMPRAAR